MAMWYVTSIVLQFSKRKALNKKGRLNSLSKLIREAGRISLLGGQFLEIFNYENITDAIGQLCRKKTAVECREWVSLTPGWAY